MQDPRTELFSAHSLNASIIVKEWYTPGAKSPERLTIALDGVQGVYPQDSPGPDSDTA